MPNSGPPFYASDAAEAARALAHQVSARRRAAYQKSEQARLKGNEAKALELKNDWAPITERNSK